MADVRPFRGLRYNPEVVGDLAQVIAPPYDVITRDEQRALHERSPYNVVRLEYGEERPEDTDWDNRYTRAARTLAQWCERAILVRDEAPAYYLYEQSFLHGGRRVWRRGIFAAVRLEPWEKGIIRPHEHTLSQPKEDRLHLLRATRTNISPVFALYRDGDSASFFETLATRTPPLVDVTDLTGQRHVLRPLVERSAVERLQSYFSTRQLYIADGHHRYETALTYRNERQATAEGWSGEEPENFVLMTVVAADDPGLVILPIHRLVRKKPPPRFKAELERFFTVEDVTPKSWDGTAVQRLLGRLTAAGQQGTAYGCIGIDEGRLFLLTLRDAGAADSLLPQHMPPVWRRLDVSILHGVILEHLLGITAVEITAGGVVEYTHDAEEAARAVEQGHFNLCFFLNPTRAYQMLAVADAGVRLPQKSTFFYPKLPTGLVMRSLDAG